MTYPTVGVSPDSGSTLHEVYNVLAGSNPQAAMDRDASKNG